jgi:iron(III) transport system substrate-binding protein
MIRRLPTALLAIALVTFACGGTGGDDSSITVYSGRSEELVAPLIEDFEQASGIDVEVRYAGSPELAATILEEGESSPADVFFAQDPASLGTVTLAGLFTTLDDAVLEAVPASFSDDEGHWVGVSGRSRVVAYDTTVVDPTDLPPTEDGLADPSWAGRVGLAPTNGSFLSFVAAKVLLDGEDATLAWLEAMAANDDPTYPSNSVILSAVNDGEVDTGLINHYYLYRLRAEQGDDVVAANHFLTGGAGALVMPAGVGILGTSDDLDAAAAFVEFLLSEDAQRYFAEETYEYPLIDGVEPAPDLPPLDSLNPPDISLSDLAGALDVATDLVTRAGLL